MSRKLRVAVVGLRFGEDFPPIYRNHPEVEYVGICDKDKTLLHGYGDRYDFNRRHSDIREILDSDDYDAVHITTPIHSHASMSVDVLMSGKHCACTVPAATTIEELHALVAAQRTSGKNYMMMETAVYTYHFLQVKEMYERGEFGRLQFLKGAHYQDMENWPSYWKGLPPMHYATHAIAPLLALAGSRAVKVHCFGSGVMREELQQNYGNPFPIETAIFKLEKDNLRTEVSRSLFHTARSYVESFNVYGELKSFEWYLEDEEPVLFSIGESTGQRGRTIDFARMALRDRQDLLPKEIAHHTEARIVYDASNPHLSVVQGGHHHGSHPHMVHEFVMSIAESRKPWIDVVTAANWTAAGICAHESAMRDGAAVVVPSFD